MFYFHKVFEPITKDIIKNAEKIATENNIEIEYIRNVRVFRKDAKIADILALRGESEGLVKIYSQLEIRKFDFTYSIKYFNKLFNI